MDSLLRIKVHREQTAAQALRRQQGLLEQQAQALQRAHDEAAQFHEYRLQQELRLFADIQGQLVALRAIEDMNRKIADLREQEVQMNNRIVEEEKRLEETKKALETARRQQVAAVREREKFEQFIEVQRAVERREQMMKEEAELEEIASAGHQAHREA